MADSPKTVKEDIIDVDESVACRSKADDEEHSVQVARITTAIETDATNEAPLLAETNKLRPSAQDETLLIGLTKVFEILDTKMATDQRERPVDKFGGNNLAAVREFFSLLEEGRGDELLAMCNISEEDGKLLRFFHTWLEQVYLRASPDHHQHASTTTPVFNQELWQDFYEAACRAQEDVLSDTRLQDEVDSLPKSSLSSVLRSHTQQHGEAEEEELTARFDGPWPISNPTLQVPLCLTEDDTITFTNLFRILNIDMSDDDRGRLINKFGGDNVDGVYEFVSFLGKHDEGRHQLLAMFNMKKSDRKLLCFFRTWFEQEYLPACYEGTAIKPQLNSETWISFCKSIVEERKVIPILIQDEDEEGVIRCDEASEDLSSLTSHMQTRLSQGHRTGGYEGGRGCLLLSPQAEIVIGEHQQDASDGNTSVLSNKFTNRNSNPENIGSLLKEMIDNLADADVQIECCGDIKGLLWERGGFVRRTRLRDFVDTLLCVLETHVDHPAVPGHIDSVLVAFCDVQTESNVTHRIPVLLDGLKVFENETMVQVHGLGVLTALATAKEDHRVSIELAGGIEFVLKLMEKHVASSTVQTSGCSLLSSLAQDESCREALVGDSEDLLGTIVQAMERHLSVVDLQCGACNLLSSLAQLEEVRKAIVSANVMSSVMAVMEEHSTNSLVSEKVAQLLCRLANSDTKAFLPPYTSWIEKESNSKFPRKQAEFSTLIKLAGNDEAKIQLVACTIMGWMHLHKTNERVQKAGLEGLAELFEGGCVHEGILKGDLIPFVRASMERHQLDSSVQDSACLLLTRLSQGDSCRVAMIRANVIPMVVGALQRHSTSDPSVRRTGGLLLSKLANIKTCDSFLDSIVDWLRCNSPRKASMLLLSAGTQSLELRLATVVILSVQIEEVRSVQKHIIRTLGEWSKDDPCTVRTLLDASWKEFVPRVIVTMEQNRLDLSFLEMACGFLAELAHNCTEYRDAIVANKGIPSVVAAMQLHSYHVGLQDAGCTLFADLAWRREEDCREAIFVARCIPTVVAAMQLHISHIELQENACKSLAHLSREDRDRCNAIVDANGAPTVLAAMRLHTSHVRLQEISCTLLANLACWGMEGCWDSIISANGIPIVLAALQQHSSHVELQEIACKLLSYLARIKNKDCCNAIVSRGGIRTVVAAMERHKLHAGLQEMACTLLERLSWKEDWCDAIVSANGVATVVAAMQQHSSYAELQEIGSKLLATLAFWRKKDCFDTIVAANGISTVLVAMKRHSSNAGLQEIACRLLTRLVEWREKDCCDAIVAANGIPTVVVAMQQHSSHIGLQEMACRLLAELAELADQEEKAWCFAILGANGIRTVVSAMQQHSSHVGLLEMSCTVFAELAYKGTKDVCHAIVAANGIQTLVAAMQDHLDQSQVQDEGCRALSNLAECGNWADSTYEQNMAGAGVICALVLAMKRHETHEDVQLWGCLAFENIAERCSPERCDEIRNQDGVLEVLRRAESNFPNDPYIPVDVHGALRALEKGWLSIVERADPLDGTTLLGDTQL